MTAANDLIRRNQGEWNEIHAVMRVLAEGRIATLRVTDKGVIPTNGSVMVDSLRTGRSGDILDYKLERDEKGAPTRLLILAEDGTELESYSHETVQNDFNDFNEALGQTKAVSAFAVPGAEELFERYHFGSGKSPSSLKQDCELVLIAPDGISEERRGFSIKSFTGKNPTLFNASNSTELLIRLAGGKGKEAIEKIKAIQPPEKKDKAQGRTKTAGGKRNWIVERVDALFDLHAFTTEVSVPKLEFSKNLALLDSNMAVVIARLMLYGRSSAVSSGSLREALELLIMDDPLGLGTKYARTYYSFRVRHFLRAAALGMTAAQRWDGNEDAEGGMLIVDSTRNLFCLLAGKKEFEQYLLATTYFDTPSTNRYENYACVIQDEEEGLYWFHMNLQIRERNPFRSSKGAGECADGIIDTKRGTTKDGHTAQTGQSNYELLLVRQQLIPQID